MAMAKAEKVMLIKLKADLSHLKKGLKDSEKHIKKTTGGLKNLGSTIKKVLGAAIILKFFKDSAAAAIRQENAIKALDTALRNTGESFNSIEGGLERVSIRLQQAASDIQKVTTVGDEASIELMQLGLSMGISSDKIKEATKHAIGLSKAYKLDLRGAIKYVSLAYAGDFNMLQRYMPQLKAVKDVTEKQRIALDAMSKGYELARSETETFGGKLQQLKNTFGDFQEAVGAGITQNKNFGEALDKVKEIFESEGFRNGIAAIVSALAEFLGLVIEITTAIPRFIGLLSDIKKEGEKVEASFETQNDQYIVALKRLAEFKKAAKDTEGFDKLNKALQKITRSSMDHADKTMLLQKILRDVKAGKYGEALAKDWEKYKKELLKSADAINKVKEKLKEKKGEIKKVNKQLKESLIVVPKVGDIQEYLKVQMGGVNLKLKEQKEKIEDTTDKIISFKEAWADAQARMQIIESITAGVINVFNRLGIETEGLINDLSEVGTGFAQFFMSKDPLTKLAGITKALGGVAGALVKLLKGKSGIEKAIERQNTWMDLTKDQTKALKDLAKQLGDTHAATSIMFEDIIAEADVTARNFNQWAYRVKEIFLDLDRGFLNTKEFMREMGEAWNSLLSEAQRLGTEGSKAMLEIMREMEARGMHIVEIEKYRTEQMDKALAGYEKFRKAGFADIKFGIFEDLKDLKERLKKNKELVEGIQGLGEALTGLSATTELTQQQFDKFSTGAVTGFEELQAKGFTASQALEIMRDQLRRLAFLQGEFGYQTNQATQGLLDLAQQEGVLDGIKEPMIEMVDVLKEIRDLFRDMAGVARGAGQSIKSSVGGAIGSLRGGMRGLRGGIDIPVVSAQQGLDAVFSKGALVQTHPGERVQVTPTSQSQSHDQRKTVYVDKIIIQVKEASNTEQLIREIKTRGKFKKELVEALT